MESHFSKLDFISQSAKLAAIIESTVNIIFALDRDGNYLIYNKAHKEMMEECYGISLAPGIARKDLPFFQADRSKIQLYLQRALNGESLTVVDQFGDPNFCRKFFEVQYNPIRNEYNQISGVAIFSQDVSQRKALENELRTAKETAQAEAKTKSLFLSSVSHEIRTPMNAILGLTELLLQKKQDENSTENLKAIRFSANNLLTIINDILDFGKIEAGKLSFDIQTFNFQEVLEELNTSVKVSAQAKRLSYEVQMSGNIPRFLKGDAVRLTQILLNLLGNSVKFTNSGKVKLSIDVVSESETEMTLEFKIADTGIGIPKDQLNNIFQSFTQVDSPQRYKTQGSGLGLAITKRLVEMQKGEIQVESQLGKGSTFTFVLTYSKPLAQEFPKNYHSAGLVEMSFANMKVLLVEDNKINQLLARQILAGWNVQVEVANDGFEAIAKLQRRKFDLILLDLQMPEIDGFEVARFVRKKFKPPYNQIPIVALTADAFTETRQLSLDAGMNDYITKPYLQTDLFRVLKKFSGIEIDEEKGAIPKLEEQVVLAQNIDFEYIKEKFGKDPETFKYILEVFKNEIGEEISDVRKHMDSGKRDLSTKVIHKLVSTFTAMGMPETAFILSLMERMAKQGDEAPLILEKLQVVEQHYDQAVLQISPILESFS